MSSLVLIFWHLLSVFSFPNLQESVMMSVTEMAAANEKSANSVGSAPAGISCQFCGSRYYGKRNAADCYGYLSNCITLQVRACLHRYYDCWLVCDDPSCGRRTMQQSVKGR
jgi:hypothetical protein